MLIPRPACPNVCVPWALLPHKGPSLEGTGSRRSRSLSSVLPLPSPGTALMADSVGSRARMDTGMSAPGRRTWLQPSLHFECFQFSLQSCVGWARELFLRQSEAYEPELQEHDGFQTTHTRTDMHARGRPCCLERAQAKRSIGPWKPSSLAASNSVSPILNRNVVVCYLILFLLEYLYGRKKRSF